MTTDINQVIQQPDIGTPVELFDIDLAVLGGPLLCLVNFAYSEQPILWRGNTYLPIPIEASGFQWTGKGPIPTPLLSIGNVGQAIGNYVRSYSDMIGAKVTRWRTLSTFLDGQPDADPDSYFPLDIYFIDRKAVDNGQMVQFELASALDQEGRTLPGRQILRDTCGNIYRAWTGTGFDYGHATCPYSGVQYFDRGGNSVGTANQDVCGKRLSDCRKRFGLRNALPFRGFPGVARTRA